jgi:hypothetical protein
VSSIEDPLLKEVLAAFKEDASRMADDLLRTITTQSLIAAFALLLAISSLLRLLFFVYFQPGPLGVPVRPIVVDTSAVVETALTVVLFLLSVISIYSLLGLRRRYSRLLAMAEKLGRWKVPLSPETRKEAEKRLTVLKMIEVFADKCPKSTLLNGPFGGDDKAFDRLLGPSGILTRTSLILASTDGRVTHYSRTDAGKVYQQVLDMQLNFLDPYTGGEVWKK